MKFEWDENKNRSNVRKHGIAFEEAVYVFSDDQALSMPDTEHSLHEERWITLGGIREHGVVLVIHTERIRGVTDHIRIISARRATKNEKKQYYIRKGEHT